MKAIASRKTWLLGSRRPLLWRTMGEVDYVNEVILDPTFLNNQKVNCVYEKLKGLSSTIFNDIIDDHFGGSKDAVLKFEIGSFPPQLSNRELTYTNYDVNNPNPNSDNSIKIRLNSTFVSNASTIEIAMAIIHESIHAELIDRCISLGIIESINSMGMVTFTGDPNSYDLPSVIFNLLVLHYANPGPNPNPNWNHDFFTVLNYRNEIIQNLINIHPWLNDMSNDFLTNVNNDPFQIGEPYTLNDLMDYMTWIGLEHSRAIMGWGLSNTLDAQASLDGITLYKGIKKWMERYHNRSHQGIGRKKPMKVYHNVA